MTKSVAKIKNKNNVKQQEIRKSSLPKSKDDDSYYKKYKKEKRERKRLQNIVGQIDNRIEKANSDNEEVFNSLIMDMNYWRLSFVLSATYGFDFLDYEQGLIEKGLMKDLPITIKDPEIEDK